LRLQYVIEANFPSDGSLDAGSHRPAAYFRLSY